MQFGSNTIYTVNSRNHLGQLTQYTFGNGAVTDRVYNVNGFPTSIKTSKSGTNYVNISYGFDNTKGLLFYRNDLIGGSGLEFFWYDNLRRLRNNGNNSTDYSDLGNITFKTDAGTLQYKNKTHPYQITDQIMKSAQHWIPICEISLTLLTEGALGPSLNRVTQLHFGTIMQANVPK